MSIFIDRSWLIFHYSVYHRNIPNMEQRKNQVKDRQLKRRAQRVAGEADWPTECTDYFTGESDDQPSPKRRIAANQAPCSDHCKCSAFIPS